MNGILELIHSSILSILEAEDASHPQLPTVYYLDPVKCKVRWMTKIDSWVLPEVHQGIWLVIFEAPPQADVQSIVDDLVAIEESLANYCLQFQAE